MGSSGSRQADGNLFGLERGDCDADDFRRGRAPRLQVARLLAGEGRVGGAGEQPRHPGHGATTYNSGGTYQWEINKTSGTKGADPGWDWQNITGALTIGATSGSQFNIDITGLNGRNNAGVEQNFNPANSASWIISTASGGVASFAANKFNLQTANFANNNPMLNGAFSVTQSGNDLLLNFTPSGTGNLPSGLGIFANDNAAQSPYGSGLTTGSNGGFGYGSWTLTNPGGSGTYRGSSTNNDAGGSGFSNINVNGNSWGLFANGGNLVEASRGITNNLTIGRTLALDFDNGSLNAGNSAGFSLRNASGQNVFEFYGTGGNTSGSDGAFAYTIAGSANQFTNLLTGSDFTRQGMHLEFALTGATTYTLTLSGAGLTPQTFTGSLQSPANGQTISTLRLFNGGAGTGGDFDQFFNSPVMTLPTFNGQAGATGNWSVASN